ncbi:MAG: hypothetical protein ACRBK7_30380 [Acidimicrobiales bacterium]
MAMTTDAHTAFDYDLADLIDALVEAVDMQRWTEIDRVRSALEPFGGTALFDAELGLNGMASIDEWCICGGEEF